MSDRERRDRRGDASTSRGSERDGGHRDDDADRGRRGEVQDDRRCDDRSRDDDRDRGRRDDRSRDADRDRGRRDDRSRDADRDRGRRDDRDRGRRDDRSRDDDRDQRRRDRSRNADRDWGRRDDRSHDDDGRRRDDDSRGDRRGLAPKARTPPPDPGIDPREVERRRREAARIAERLADRARAEAAAASRRPLAVDTTAPVGAGGDHLDSRSGPPSTRFVWEKKIERDVVERGASRKDYGSAAERARAAARAAELEEVRAMRVKREQERAQREADRELEDRDAARAEADALETRELAQARDALARGAAIRISDNRGTPADSLIRVALLADELGLADDGLGPAEGDPIAAALAGEDASGCWACVASLEAALEADRGAMPDPDLNARRVWWESCLVAARAEAEAREREEAAEAERLRGGAGAASTSGAAADAPRPRDAVVPGVEADVEEMMRGRSSAELDELRREAAEFAGAGEDPEYWSAVGALLTVGAARARASECRRDRIAAWRGRGELVGRGPLSGVPAEHSRREREEAAAQSAEAFEAAMALPGPPPGPLPPGPPLVEPPPKAEGTAPGSLAEALALEEAEAAAAPAVPSAQAAGGDEALDIDSDSSGDGPEDAAPAAPAVPAPPAPAVCSPLPSPRPLLIPPYVPGRWSPPPVRVPALASSAEMEAAEAAFRAGTGPPPGPAPPGVPPGASWDVVDEEEDAAWLRAARAKTAWAAARRLAMAQGGAAAAAGIVAAAAAASPSTGHPGGGVQAEAGLRARLAARGAGGSAGTAASAADAADRRLEAEALRAMRAADAGRDDDPSVGGDLDLSRASEVALAGQVFWWRDRHAPRRPRYLNRVATGFDWTKYNRAHYDSDHLPPKVVQGYKARDVGCSRGGGSGFVHIPCPSCRRRSPSRPLAVQHLLSRSPRPLGRPHVHDRARSDLFRRVDVRPALSGGSSIRGCGLPRRQQAMGDVSPAWIPVRL